MTLFQRFGNVYELLINEEKRWAVEGPALTRLLADLPSVEDAPRVLDLACGTGFHARHLAAAGARVTGIDSSAGMLAAARRAADSNLTIDWREADILSPVESSFDLILLLGNTLSLLPDPAAFFKVAAAALAPQGRLIVQTIDYETLRCGGIRTVTRQGAVEERDTIVTKVMTPLASGALLAFLVQQEQEGVWNCADEQTRLREVERPALEEIANAAGLVLEQETGDLAGTACEPGVTSDVVTLWCFPEA